jgi:hypothetical protein
VISIFHISSKFVRDVKLVKENCQRMDTEQQYCKKHRNTILMIIIKTQSNVFMVVKIPTATGKGHAMVQVVSHWPPTTEAQVPS